MTCQIFMLRKELCALALSILWPSEEDLAYIIESATSKCTGKKLSELNGTLESRERSQNDTKCIQFVR